jgi:hypothetical protein
MPHLVRTSELGHFRGGIVARFGALAHLHFAAVFPPAMPEARVRFAPSLASVVLRLGARSLLFWRWRWAD